MRTEVVEPSLVEIYVLYMAVEMATHVNYQLTNLRVL